MLFLLKTTSIFENKETYQEASQENGLIYSNATIQDLVNKDTDGDGIPDWQEGLYGLDPTKKETTPGTPDSVAIEKLKATQTKSTGIVKGDSMTNSSTENLTQTDQFSRELFATVAALNQNGIMDQTTIDTLGASLAEKINNPVVRKVFLISDIKIIDNDTKQTIKKYSDTLNSIYIKNPNKKGVMDVLQEFTNDEKNVGILSELNPIIDQTNKIINESLKIPTPRSLSLLHLDLINSLQRVEENISDMQLFDSDIVLATSAISKYGENATALGSAADKLIGTINQKLNN